MGEVLYLPARPATEQLWTKRELARRWQVSERWVELRMRDDGLPFLKDQPSRLVRFRPTEVEAWLHGRRAS